MAPSSTQPSEEDWSVRSAVCIAVGSHVCSFCVLHPDKRSAITPTTFANAAPRFALLQTQLERLGTPKRQVLVGLEACGGYFAETMEKERGCQGIQGF